MTVQETPGVTADMSSTSLYVGNLHEEVTEATLFKMFNAVGPVASVRVCRDVVTRRGLGYGYVNFHRTEDAQLALSTMNYKPVRGRAIRLMWSQRDPSLRRSGLGNIFIKNLHKDIDNRVLHDTFSAFGEVLSCKVVTDERKGSLGYGFVAFKTPEEAQLAIEKVNGKLIMGQPVSVEAFKPREERKTYVDLYTNVFIKNMPKNITTENQLREIFAPYGEITSCQIALENNESKGFGFVNFAAHDMAQAAVDGLNGRSLDGMTLYVARAQTRGERAKQLYEQREKVKAERRQKTKNVNLYIKNLANEVTDEILLREFEPFGTVTSVKVMTDDGKSKGFGFVCFQTEESAKTATEAMNGKKLAGKPIYISLAQSKEERQAQLESEFAARNAAQGRVLTVPGAAPMVPFERSMAGLAGLSLGPTMQQPVYGWGKGGGVGGGPLPPTLRPPPLQPHQRISSPVSPTPPQGGEQVSNVIGTKHGPVHWRPVSAVKCAVTLEDLSSIAPEKQKQMLGEMLFPTVKEMQPHLAGKITGMLLELPIPKLIVLANHPRELREKVQEAMAVLQQMDPQLQHANPQSQQVS